MTDRATGLTWAAADSGTPMTWKEALAFARSSTLGGHRDWRLPNAKELQYIVDYTRSPDTTDSPAIDPVFSATRTTNEAGQKDFGHYWTSTTHVDGPRPDNAVTVCFGRAMGKMHGRVMDVHGAGAQRSDPKSGGNSIGRGPQGDARHGKNFVRLVRGGETRLARALAPSRQRIPTWCISIRDMRQRPAAATCKTRAGWATRATVPGGLSGGWTGTGTTGSPKKSLTARRHTFPGLTGTGTASSPRTRPRPAPRRAVPVAAKPYPASWTG